MNFEVAKDPGSRTRQVDVVKVGKDGSKKKLRLYFYEDDFGSGLYYPGYRGRIIALTAKQVEQAKDFAREHNARIALGKDSPDW